MFVYWVCDTCGKSGRYYVQRPIGHTLTPMDLEAELELLAGPLRLIQEQHQHEIKIVPENSARVAHLKVAAWTQPTLTPTRF